MSRYPQPYIGQQQRSYPDDRRFTMDVLISPPRRYGDQRSPPLRYESREVYNDRNTFFSLSSRREEILQRERERIIPPNRGAANNLRRNSYESNIRSNPQQQQRRYTARNATPHQRNSVPHQRTQSLNIPARNFRQQPRLPLVPPPSPMGGKRPFPGVSDGRDKKTKLEDEYEEKEYFILVDEVKMFKEEVCNCITSEFIDRICETKARYFYHLKEKGHAKALELSIKKKRPSPLMFKFHCTTCDAYINDEHIYNVHLKTNMHFQIKIVYDSLGLLAKDWLSAKTNPNHLLKSSSWKAEQEGLYISTKKNLLKDDAFVDDTWLKTIDRTTIKDVDQFILQSLEVRMKTIWPQPKGEHFCRVCNYSEYATDELLQRHHKSARHLDFQRHYDEAYCVSCQRHNGDKEGMRKHLLTRHHKDIQEIMDEVKLQAAIFWESKSSSGSDETAPRPSTEPLPSSLLNIDQHDVKEEAIVTDDVIDLTDEKPSNIKMNKFTTQASNVGIVNPMITTNIIQHTSSSSKSTSVTSGSSGFTSSSKNSTTTVTSTIHTSRETIVIDERRDIESRIDKEVANIKDLSKELSYEHEKPCKSKFVEFLDDHHDSIAAEEKAAVLKNKPTKFDDFIVPLTGYMCTICHQTLDNDQEATTHMNGYQHSKNRQHYDTKYS